MRYEVLASKKYLHEGNGCLAVSKPEIIPSVEHAPRLGQFQNHD
jgi:hypothetical protein